MGLGIPGPQVTEGDRPFYIRSREPLASLAALLGSRPIHVEDIAHWPVHLGRWRDYVGYPAEPADLDLNPDPSGCVWVWPGVSVTGISLANLDRAWRQHYDYRIGIDADGRWRFFMAGYYEPGVSPQPPPCGES
jgi:hypothetical protein